MRFYDLKSSSAVTTTSGYTGATLTNTGVSTWSATNGATYTSTAGTSVATTNYYGGPAFTVEVNFKQTATSTSE